MKTIIMKLAMAMLIIPMLCGCGVSENNSPDSNANEFDVSGHYGATHYTAFSMVDNTTGVEYIVVLHSHGVGITPRYNADGSFYMGDKDEN